MPPGPAPCRRRAGSPPPQRPALEQDDVLQAGPAEARHLRRPRCRPRRRRHRRSGAPCLPRPRDLVQTEQSVNEPRGAPMYGLTPADLDLQRRTRVHRRAHRFRARGRGARRPAARRGGQGAPRAGDRARSLRHQHAGLGRRPRPQHPQQVRSRSRPAGHQRDLPGACTPLSWWPEVANDHQRDTWPLRPCAESRSATRSRRSAGSDVADPTATAARDGDDYVLDGVKWHVTSFHEAQYVFFQAVLTTGATPATRRCSSWTRRRPVRVVRTPSYARRRPPAPRGRVREGQGAVHPPRRQRGGRHVLRLRVVPFERLMVAARCLGAAERLVEEATAFAAAGDHGAAR